MIDASTLAAGRWVAVLVVGIALAVGLTRARRSPFGERPDGELPDTTVPFALAVVAWAVLSVVAGALVDVRTSPYWQRALAGQVVYVAIAAGLWPFLAASSFRPVASRGRLVVIAAAGGVVTFLGVSLIGDLVTLFYSAFGIDPLLQDNVNAARGEWSLDVAAVFVSALVTAPIAEEVFYRGTLMPALARAMPLRWALFLQALAFGMMHVLGDPARWPIGLALSAVGLATGWIYLRTASIWVAVGVHVVFNALNLFVLRVGIEATP